MYQLEYDPDLKDNKGNLNVKIPRNVLDKILEKLREIARTENPPSDKKLKGDLEGCYKVREDGYRAIYSIDSKRGKLVVLHIGPRKTVYTRS